MGLKVIETDASLEAEAPTVTVKDYLAMLAGELANAQRHGAISDEPEGSRFITVSDSWAMNVSGMLMKCVAAMGGKDNDEEGVEDSDS